MDLVDRLKAMAEGGHDALDCPPGAVKPPLEDHDCWKAATKIKRLEADLEQSEASRREMGEDYALCAAQLAEMQTALSNLIVYTAELEDTRITPLKDAMTPARHALATDAGKAAADLLAAAVHYRRFMVGGDKPPDHSPYIKENGRLGKSPHAEFCDAVDAYRKEKRHDG